MKVQSAMTFTAVLLTGSWLSAAEQKVEMKDLPPAVQQAVQEQSKGATVRGLTKEVEHGKTEYEAELTVNGHGRDVSFDSSGKVTGVEEEVPIASIPPAARSAIQSAASGGKVNKVELVTEGGRTFYEASIRKGAKKSEIQVDSNGKRVKED